ncbi:hypothetical protein ACIA5D_50915 [Actinoplanes sp. NPDC051513]|uniref:hypothetical protein n=1 Tax=Actinoplanes sp. NPDC051513 TaxID=3363908 RepID=UPI00379F6E31
MALVRTLRNTEYWPDFSAIAVRDGVGSDTDERISVPVGLHAYDIGMGFGTAGLAGAGEFMVSGRRAASGVP